MIPLLRMAAGLALNRSPEHRWRRVSVLTSTLIFMLLVLAATSIITMAVREGERGDRRTGQTATSRSSTDLYMMHRSDRFGQEHIAVVWIEPVSLDVEPVLPPGVTRLPAPGQSVVSPALDRLAVQHPELAARYPDRVVLGWQGVRSGGELLAYIRPQQGRGLGGEDSAIEVQSGRIKGELPVFRMSGFGSSSVDTIPFGVGDPPAAPIRAVVGGVLALLVVPAVIVLAVGTSAASGVRDHRFAVLRSIGARDRSINTLAVAETLVLVMPGFVAATVLWAVVSPQLAAVPLVGYEVVPGDLGLPWWRLVLTVLVASALSATLASLAVTGAVARRVDRPRPSARPVRFSKLRFVPLAAAALAFLLGKLDGSGRAADFYLVGIVAAVAAVPLIAPGLLRPIGALMAQSRAIPRAIAGRTVQRDPARAALPFVGGAALLVLALASIGYVALNRNTDAPEVPTDAVRAVLVEWRDPHPGDVGRLVHAVGAGLAAPYTEAQTHGDDSHIDGEKGESEGIVSVGVQCTELAPFFSGAHCEPGSPFTLPATTSRQLTGMFSVIAHETVTEVKLVPPSKLGEAASAFFIDNLPLDALAEHVRTAAMPLVPAPTVETTLVSGSQESPLVPWIIGGAVVAAIGLALAFLLSLIDRLLAARAHHRLLINLGIHPRQLAMLGAWMFAAPYSAIGIASFATGLAVCASLVLPGTAIPWNAIGTTAAIGAAAGVVGTICVASFSARGALRERE